MVFDGGDTTNNPHVIGAEARLARMLIDAGAVLRAVRVPAPVVDVKVGIDDYLVTQKEPVVALRALLDSALWADPLTRAAIAMRRRTP